MPTSVKNIVVDRSEQLNGVLLKAVAGRLDCRSPGRERPDSLCLLKTPATEKDVSPRLTFDSLRMYRQDYVQLGVAPELAISANKTVTSRNILPSAPPAPSGQVVSSVSPASTKKIVATFSLSALYERLGKDSSPTVSTKTV